MDDEPQVFVKSDDAHDYMAWKQGRELLLLQALVIRKTRVQLGKGQVCDIQVGYYTPTGKSYPCTIELKNIHCERSTSSEYVCNPGLGALGASLLLRLGPVVFVLGRYPNRRPLSPAVGNKLPQFRDSGSTRQLIVCCGADCGVLFIQGAVVADFFASPRV